MFFSILNAIVIFTTLSIQLVNSVVYKLEPNRYLIENQDNIHGETKINLTLDQKIGQKVNTFNLGAQFEKYDLINGQYVWLVGSLQNEAHVYFSKDDGKTFKKYEKVKSIDNVYVNQDHKAIVLFHDKTNKKIYLSKDNGINIEEKQLNFNVSYFKFNHDKKTILAIETKDDVYIPWLSTDFGQNWVCLGETIIKMPMWRENDKSGYLYYVKKNGSFIENKEQESINNFDGKIINFDVSENHVFVTILKSESNLELQILPKKQTEKRWIAAKFNSINKIKGIDYAWDNSEEIVVAVTFEENGKIKSDLYNTTDTINFKFEKFLDNVEIKEIKLKGQKSKRVVDLIEINRDRGVFIANKKTDNGMLETVVKTPKSQWLGINPKDQKVNNLDLLNYFYWVHQKPQSVIGDLKLPEFILATTRGNDQNPYLYIHQSSAQKWPTLLKGNYSYTYSNERDLIMIINKSEKTNKILVSKNYGQDWFAFKFTNELVHADEFIIIPNGNSHILFATETKSKKSVLFSFDINNLYENDECHKKCNHKSLEKEICATCDTTVDCQNDSDQNECPIGAQVLSPTTETETATTTTTSTTTTTTSTTTTTPTKETYFINPSIIIDPESIFFDHPKQNQSSKPIKLTPVYNFIMPVFILIAVLISLFCLLVAIRIRSHLKSRILSGKKDKRSEYLFIYKQAQPLVENSMVGVKNSPIGHNIAYNIDEKECLFDLNKC